MNDRKVVLPYQQKSRKLTVLELVMQYTVLVRTVDHNPPEIAQNIAKQHLLKHLLTSYILDKYINESLTNLHQSPILTIMRPFSLVKALYQQT